MNTFQKPGDQITLIAPSGGVTAGVGYQIGQLFVVACTTAAQDEPFEARTRGVFTLPKADGAGSAWVQGARLYWDGDEGALGLSGQVHIGYALEAANDDADEGVVLLSGPGNAPEIFVSAEATGTGSSQDIAHSLGKIPSKVLAAVSVHPGTPDTGAFTLAYGAHDATNLKFTCTTGVKFYAIAIA